MTCNVFGGSLNLTQPINQSTCQSHEWANTYFVNGHSNDVMRSQCNSKPLAEKEGQSDRVVIVMGE